MRENENVSLKKDAEQLRKELKVATTNNSVAEAKINKLSEDLEKMRGVVKTAKQEEKVGRLKLELFH